MSKIINCYECKRPFKNEKAFNAVCDDCLTEEDEELERRESTERYDAFLREQAAWDLKRLDLPGNGQETYTPPTQDSKVETATGYTVDDEGEINYDET